MWMAIAMAVSAVVSGLAANQAGKANQAVANANAALMDAKAKSEKRHADFKANIKRDKGKREKGRGMATFAKSGVTVEGTPIEVLGEMAQDIEFGAQLEIYEGEVKAKEAKDKANMFRFEGKVARQKGKTALTTSILGAGASMAGAAGKAGMFKSSAPVYNTTASGSMSYGTNQTYFSGGNTSGL